MLLRDVKDFWRTAHCVAVWLMRSNESGRTFGSIGVVNDAIPGQFGLPPSLKLRWQHRSSEEGRCSSTRLLALTEWKFFHLSHTRMVTWIWKCHLSLQGQSSAQWMGKRINSVWTINLSKMLTQLSYFKWRCLTRFFGGNVSVVASTLCCGHLQFLSPSHQSTWP